LGQAEASAAALQKLCLHAQAFTSFVSIEPPNALLLEIKGSVKLFGSLQRLHADIDAGWRRLALAARSATAPSTLAALWLARAGEPLQIEEAEMLPGHLAKVPIACTAWDSEWLQTLRAMGVRIWTSRWHGSLRRAEHSCRVNAFANAVISKRRSSMSLIWKRHSNH
jgi:protein ImuB